MSSLRQVCLRKTGDNTMGRPGVEGRATNSSGSKNGTASTSATSEKPAPDFLRTLVPAIVGADGALLVGEGRPALFAGGLD